MIDNSGGEDQQKRGTSMDEQQEVKELQEQTGKKKGKWAKGTMERGFLSGCFLRFYAAHSEFIWFVC